ncbi:MAG: hypothetical protein ACK56F_23955, partial [bacterium]
LLDRGGAGLLGTDVKNQGGHAVRPGRRPPPAPPHCLRRGVRRGPREVRRRRRGGGFWPTPGVWVAGPCGRSPRG